MYNITIESLYDAYYDTNRGTADMIPFSLRIDEEIFNLWRELRNGTYHISTTKAFIVRGRKKREIFAMQPRDKIVNHWVKLRLEPLLEEEFEDGCYSCRKGKGLSAFARDASAAIRRLTKDYTKPCYLAHLDVCNFFLSIDRHLALERALKIADRYEGEDKPALRWLISEILLFAPEENYYICGNPNDWKDYPPEKSMLTNPGSGLMMGSVNSQFIANLVLTPTDRYAASLGVVILRYVDDILLLCEDKRQLLESVPRIERFLYEDTGLRLHFHKRYFQDSAKGVSIVGYTFKDRRTYISNRCIGNALNRAHAFKYDQEQAERFISCINSYLGRTMECRAYNQRAKILDALHPEWWQEICAREHLRKIEKRRKKPIFVQNDFGRIIPASRRGAGRIADRGANPGCD